MSVSFLGSQHVQGGSIGLSTGRASTANASANTKGSYTSTPHFTATTAGAAWVQVDLLRSTLAGDFLVDIAVGAAASEQVIIADLPYSCNSSASFPMASYLFPLFIPAGSRIASRCQSALGTGAMTTQLTLFAPMFGGELGLGQVEACGAVTATSLGTSVDPGGTANTKGTTPTQLIAATSFAYKWVCVSINHTNALATAGFWTVDLMVGGAGSEVVVVPDLSLFMSTTADTNPAIGMCFPLAIPAGTRISARCQSSITTASERLLEIVLHGVG